MVLERFLIGEELSLPSLPQKLPLVIENGDQKCGDFAEFAEYLSANKAHLRKSLLEYGGILFRGFPVKSAAEFHRSVGTLGFALEKENPLDTSPRENVTEGVYTSTETPAWIPILVHNENCFLRKRPGVIAFYAMEAPAKYGETPIFDSRAAYHALPAAIAAKLKDKQVMYRRRLPRKKKPWAPNVVRSWQEAFGTEDRDAIVEIAKLNHLDCSWHPDGNILHTEAVVNPIPAHPETGDPCLNIQAFHRDSVMADLDGIRHRQNPFANWIVKAGAAMIFSLDTVPMKMHWGDGTEIAKEEMIAIRDALWNNSVVFRWQTGDLLLLDNFLTAHGRMNVIKPRKILVTLGDLVEVN